MYKKYISRIGNTPLIRFKKSNIYLKLEGHNPSGSIKDRSISTMVLNIKDKNKPYCLVTSGSAGISLYNLHTSLCMKNDIIITIPLQYSNKKIPSMLINKNNIKLHNTFDSVQVLNNGTINIVLIDDIFMNVFSHTKNIINENKWILLDQHYNTDCIDIHKKTVNEILMDCPDVTDVICATGTGGTAAGLMKYLPSHINVHSRPSISGEIEGLSDVGRYANYCNPLNICNYYESHYTLDEAIKYKNIIEKNSKFSVGYSTGVSFGLAKKINMTDKLITDKRKVKPNKKIVVISPDGIYNE